MIASDNDDVRKSLNALNTHKFFVFFLFSKSEPCGKPEDIPHSKVVGSSFNFNDQLRYECIKGYTLTGPKLRTCGNDGKWSEAPRCESKSRPVICIRTSWPVFRDTKRGVASG